MGNRFFRPEVSHSLEEIGDYVKSSVESLQLSKKSLALIEKGAKIVHKASSSKRPIYGINTGFGRLAQKKIPDRDLVRLQINILRSHACGIGEPVSESVTRRLLVLRALSLGKGHSGVASSLVQRHLDYLNRQLVPYIPIQGSVGASGDLAPLAHLGLTFMGEGEFVLKGLRRSAGAVLKTARLKPLAIGPKEGLALVNGTQFSLALALEAYDSLQSLIGPMEAAAALTIEAHRATAAVFDERLHLLKAHPHQRQIAKKFREMLKGSTHMTGHADCDLVQDAYSFRCIPQVLGPCYALIEQARQFLEDEVNSVSDNPVIVFQGEELLSGGHFHAHAVSFASDLLSMAATTMSNLVERRIDQLVNPLTTRGNAFLADEAGVESGLMILQTAVAALASENKTLVHPASADTIPTNGNQEDHVSMAPWAARKAASIIENLRRIVAAEILASVRGCLREKEKMKLSYSPFVEKELERWTRVVPELSGRGDLHFGRLWEAVIREIS